MFRKIKAWFGFPLVTEYQKEVEKVIKERLSELEMSENKKKAPAKKKAPTKKKAPVKKSPAKKAPAKKSK